MGEVPLVSKADGEGKDFSWHVWYMKVLKPFSLFFAPACIA